MCLDAPLVQRFIGPEKVVVTVRSVDGKRIS